MSKVVSVIIMCFLFSNIVNASDMGSAPPEEQEPIPVFYAQASYIAAILTGPEDQIKNLSGLNLARQTKLYTGEIRVTANDDTNRLTVVVNAADFATIKRIVSRLDCRKYQRPIEELLQGIND